MKYSLRIFVIVLACFACVACQTAPKPKPLTELSDAERIEMYRYGALPIKNTKQKSEDRNSAAIATGEFFLYLPLLVWYCLAGGGGQISVGK